ncbi:MAG: long-chain fatty acid--CoA ligase [Candidatus Binatus sp.]|uniref:AMP-dependent synthetase/ligase n=1 Tax=Candidatus Binatus sp. TaxID=2811406 RepID=UPI00271DD646|nr:long-chain fatty acid--CoA ligase [Candidatus Binatus sp.]MDO8432858.1 long-chain fatty acid--CoA ligase [Candidatus Binatus sp.]
MDDLIISRLATLPQAFETRARQYGPRAFLKDKRNKAWVDHSWNEISDAASKLRAGLARLGVKPGDRVAILSENCPEWIIVDQAVLGLGAVVVPLYTTGGLEETAHVINDSGAKIIAANGPDLIRKILGLQSSLPNISAIIAMHPGAESVVATNGAPIVMTLESISAGDSAGIVEGSRDDLATIIYTSGTTGMSKGVMLSHGNILANGEDALAALSLNETDVTLSHLPIAHSFERTAGYYTVMMGGGTIAFAEGFGQIASNLLEIEPTVLLTVPRLLEAIHSRVMRTVEASPPFRQKMFRTALAVGGQAAEYRLRGKSVPAHLALAMALFRRIVFAKIRAIFGSRLRYLIAGGAPLPAEINRFLAAAEVPIVEGYGLTEASPVVSCNLHEGRTRIGSVGLPLKHIEVTTAPDGELLMRGPNIMKGYFNREAETKEAIDADGWLHTGDIAKIDAEGYISITDRKKEIIVLSGGKNISPAYVESKLAGDKFIAQSCVFGDRKKHLAALIVPDYENLADFLKENNLDPKEAGEIAKSAALRTLLQTRIRELNKQLSDVEAVSAFAIVPNAFSQENGELTPSLKVRRKMVQAHYQDQIDSMFRD